MPLSGEIPSRQAYLKGPGGDDSFYGVSRAAPSLGSGAGGGGERSPEARDSGAGLSRSRHGSPIRCSVEPSRVWSQITHQQGFGDVSAAADRPAAESLAALAPVGSIGAFDASRRGQPSGMELPHLVTRRSRVRITPPGSACDTRGQGVQVRAEAQTWQAVDDDKAPLQESPPTYRLASSGSLAQVAVLDDAGPGQVRGAGLAPAGSSKSAFSLVNPAIGTDAPAPQAPSDNISNTEALSLRAAGSRSSESFAEALGKLCASLELEIRPGVTGSSSASDTAVVPTFQEAVAQSEASCRRRSEPTRAARPCVVCRV